ncbi:hypothetical protein ABB37_02407 [Leptomonas pyrrhocoris]|uniref:Peptidase S1 domain-containing protein n=1 Tax=Leptomonas pyrrhocoris TaxID=157538 RepID=A0A0N0DYR9_LEPPY|nr:hypothetical protein ABB37_02407 [Leptomonas pyrrhocoris]KPA84435.1 hypothetical protein ABB37_02407 [Leptomonas pyrrhocoris]|eukprot:XP_015662874.1 hypothetical protein ABB37_02407 [Leptomonas pyrrhocoris]
MSKPLWLMMGTAFPFETPSSGSSSPQLLLTAKHTFAPWDYAKDASQMKIPADYRKLRFVVGCIYRPNEEGQSVASEKVGLRLVSQHPQLDVAVVAVDDKGDVKTPSVTTAATATMASSPSRAVFSSPLPLCTTRYPAAADGLLLGYRGMERLGELDTLDPSLLQRLSPGERDALLVDLQDIEGKQIRASTTVSILDERGMCKGTGDRATCFHGMSGGPLLTTSGTCAGVLYGHHPDAPGCLGYTPCADFAEWLAGVVQRVSQRNEEA